MFWYLLLFLFAWLPSIIHVKLYVCLEKRLWVVFNFHDYETHSWWSSSFPCFPGPYCIHTPFEQYIYALGIYIFTSNINQTFTCTHALICYNIRAADAEQMDHCRRRHLKTPFECETSHVHTRIIFCLTQNAHIIHNRFFVAIRYSERSEQASKQSSVVGTSI